MSSRYQINKHHMKCPNNSNSYYQQVKLQLRLPHAKIPSDPLPNFVVGPSNTPLLTKSKLGTTTVSTPVIIIPTLNDRVTFTLACCFQF